MLGEIEALAKQHADFGFETTPAGRGHLNLIRDLKRRGYEVLAPRAWSWRYRACRNAYCGAEPIFQLE
jgi:hypothetical protein